MSRIILVIAIIFVFSNCSGYSNKKSLLTIRQSIAKEYSKCKKAELRLEGLIINPDFNCLSLKGDSIAFKQIIGGGKFVILYDTRKCDMCFNAIYDQIRWGFPSMLSEEVVVFTNYKNAKILQISKQQKLREVSIYNVKSSFFDEYLPSTVALAFVTNELIFKEVYMPTPDQEMVEVTNEYLERLRQKIELYKTSQKPSLWN